MKPKSVSSGLFLLIALAALGAVLVFLPSWLASQYETVAQAGEFWVWVYFISVGFGAALLIGCAVFVVVRLWLATRRSRRRRHERDKSPSQLSASEKRREIEENLEAALDLGGDKAASPELRREIDPLVRRIERKRQQRTLEIVAFGTISSGKSSLLNLLAGRDVFQTDPKGGTTLRRSEGPWPGIDRVVLVDTPGLGEVGGAERVREAADAARDADLVLLVVDGPLRESEHQLLRRLFEMEKRLLICLNKQDWYDAAERDALLAQIARQAGEGLHREDIVAVRAVPTVRPRVRVGPDGRETHEEVPVPADIEPLAERMMQVVRSEAESLLLANLLLQSRGLIEEARQKVQQSLDRRARQIVDRYMWSAGGAAALSPFPLVDLAAGCAISTKMVVDLARVYRQDVDLDVAVQLLGEMGKNLVSVLGASAVTPAVTAGVASLLKTVPGVGTVAGGLLQGVVQALVTRWIGGVFIEYFRNHMRRPEGGLAGLARRQWQQITSPDHLRRLVDQVRRRGDDDDDGDDDGDNNDQQA